MLPAFAAKRLRRGVRHESGSRLTILTEPGRRNRPKSAQIALQRKWEQKAFRPSARPLVSPESNNPQK
jgi:hypothetical protein